MTYIHNWIYSILKSLKISKSMWKVQMICRSQSLGFKDRNKQFKMNKIITQTNIKEFPPDDKLSWLKT